MGSREPEQWILLIHQLPPNPTKLRVGVWRKLQTIGAISIKNSVYVLPFNEKTDEDFQWLRQEIEAAGGDASLFRAGSVEGATDKEIIELFRTARDEEYKKLITEFEALSGAVRALSTSNTVSVAKLAQCEAEMSNLRQELERVKATDFFRAALGSKARDSFEKCRARIQAIKERSTRKDTKKGETSALKIADHQNRRWATRRNPHIDRLASGWLIRRFIDKRPRFLFIEEDERPAGAITFDMADGDLTHHGQDCTFETMIKRFGLAGDAALAEIAEIVHDIDLKDSKFDRREASGLNAVIRGLSAVFPDDGERLKQSLPVFDALYELFRQESDAVHAKGVRGRRKARKLKRPSTGK